MVICNTNIGVCLPLQFRMMLMDDYIDKYFDNMPVNIPPKQDFDICRNEFIKSQRFSKSKDQGI